MWAVGVIFFKLLTGENLVDLDRERSSTAEFGRMLLAVVNGVERDIVDDAAQKIKKCARRVTMTHHSIQTSDHRP